MTMLSTVVNIYMFTKSNVQIFKDKSSWRHMTHLLQDIWVEFEDAQEDLLVSG